MSLQREKTKNKKQKTKKQKNKKKNKKKTGIWHFTKQKIRALSVV